MPGYHGDDQSEERLAEEAKAAGFPILIKAVLGGGGKGMKLAGNSAEFLVSCFCQAPTCCQNERARTSSPMFGLESSGTFIAQTTHPQHRPILLLLCNAGCPEIGSEGSHGLILRRPGFS